jgi:hypothetical protein
VLALVGCSLLGASTLWSACTSPLPGGPLASLGPESRDRRTIAGRPVERLRAGSYTYLRVEDDQGQRRWVVTLGRVPEGAARVEARTLARASDFQSKRLRRRFDELFFATVRAVAP